LFSGSKEALLYERLAADRQADQYDRMLGRDHAANQLGIGIGALLGGFVAYFSMEATLWLCLPPLAVGALVALTLRDPRRADAASEDDTSPSFSSHFANALAEFRNHPWIRFLTLYI